MFLLEERNNKVNAIYAEAYGIETWGHSVQRSIGRKRKYWYYCDWYGCIDSCFYSKINVVFQSVDLAEMLDYAFEHYPNDYIRIQESLFEQIDSIKSKSIWE